MDPSDFNNPIVKALASAAVSHLIAQIKGMTASAKMEQERRNLLDEMIADTAGDAKKLEARIGKLEASVSEEHLMAVLCRLWPETLSSMTRERRRLMAAALAGIAAPDLTVEQKSRVTRAIATLEPSDILHLRMFADYGKVEPGAPQIPDNALEAWRKTERGKVYEAFALEAAGCLAFRENGYIPTQLGRDVLKHLRVWEPESVGTSPSQDP